LSENSALANEASPALTLDSGPKWVRRANSLNHNLETQGSLKTGQQIKFETFRKVRIMKAGAAA
jgi:hypothetical protein